MPSRRAFLLMVAALLPSSFWRSLLAPSFGYLSQNFDVLVSESLSVRVAKPNLLGLEVNPLFCAVQGLYERITRALLRIPLI